MTDDFDLVRGSGNVFSDLGRDDAQLKQLKSLLAAEIIGTLDKRGLTVRAAEALTGVAAADFSRIRHARLDRFTVDRLMVLIHRLGREMDMSVTFRPLTAA